MVTEGFSSGEEEAEKVLLSESEEEEEEEEELVILPEAIIAVEEMVMHLESIEAEIAAERARVEAERLAREAAAWKINPKRCATVIQSHWRGHNARQDWRREKERRRIAALEDEEGHKHGDLGILLGFLERSEFNDTEILPSNLKATEKQRKTTNELKVQRFAARFRRNTARDLSRFFSRFDSFRTRHDTTRLTRGNFSWWFGCSLSLNRPK